MKNKVMYAGIILLMTTVFWSCQKEELLPGGKLTLKSAVTPTEVTDWQAGSAEDECTQAGNCAEETFSYKIDSWGSEGMDGDYLYEGVNEAMDEISNTISISNNDGQSFDWTSEMPVCKVIVKGGPSANIYYYPDGSTGDEGLVAPVNPNNSKNYDISHVTFCFYENPPTSEPDCEWICETAWSWGTRYVTKGNWATYTSYSPAKTVDLYAGQTKPAGTVTFSAPVAGKVTVTIELASGFRLKELDDVVVSDAVKVQGYASKPAAVNPAPGQFTSYKGSELSFEVNAAAFYGVHVDVEWEKCEE